MKIKDTLISTSIGDITKADSVDAIVNSTDTSMSGDSGLNKAIHLAAGEKLRKACEKLGKCQIGEAKATDAYNLPCKYIIHTVGPAWNKGEHGEKEQLRSCYQSVLEIAKGLQIRTIAFPSISTGTHGFPLDEAAEIAVNAVANFVKSYPGSFDEIKWITRDEETKEAYDKALKDREKIELISSKYNPAEEAEYKLCIQELFDMRSDERDCQNQILQVLSVAATAMSILFGGGLLFGKPEDKNISFISNLSDKKGFSLAVANYCTQARLVFLITSIILCVAITYTLKLCIGNMLRYYHTKELQNRITELQHNIYNVEEFLFWDEYRMTVMTLNSKHLLSPFAVSHFITYSLAISFLLIFCVSISFIQFYIINPKQWYDYLGFSFVISTVLFCVIEFIFTSQDSDGLRKWIKDAAKKRRKDEYNSQSEIWHNIVYFIYPRTNDLQKPMLIICSAVLAYFLRNNYNDWSMIPDLLFRLFLTLIIFDYCWYQARFQINDLRGMEEDNQSEKNKRLIVTENNCALYYKISIIVLFIRLCLGVLLLFFFRKILWPVLGIQMIFLTAFTIVYEIVRAIKFDKGVFFLVGSGYPLRVFVGAMTVLTLKDALSQIPISNIILLLSGIYLWGIFASVLAWIQDIIAIKKKSEKAENPQVNFEKAHFQSLYLKIKSRISSEYPLREKGELKDFWNGSYFLSVFLLSLISIQIYCGNLRNIFPGVIKTTYILEFLMLMVMIVVCYYLKNECLEVGCILTIIISIIKAVAAVYMVMSMVLNHFVPVKDLRIIICVFIFQLLIQTTYYFLRYEPRPISIRDTILLLVKKLGIVVFTEKVVNKLVGKGKNDC